MFGSLSVGGQETPAFRPQQHPTLAHTSSRVETVFICEASVFSLWRQPLCFLFTSWMCGCVQLTHTFTPTHHSHNTARTQTPKPRAHPHIRTLSNVHPNTSLFQLPGSGNLIRSDHLNGRPSSTDAHPFTYSLSSRLLPAVTVPTQGLVSLASFMPRTFSTCLVFRSSHSGFAWVNARVCLARIPEQQPRSKGPMGMSLHEPRMGACQVRKGHQGKRHWEVTWLLPQGL